MPDMAGSEALGQSAHVLVDHNKQLLQRPYTHGWNATLGYCFECCHSFLALEIYVHVKWK